MKTFRKIIHRLLLELRKSSLLRQKSLRALVWTHNTSYHLISLLASHKGLHPKHEIMRYEKFFLDHIEPTDRVLDVGSGNGRIASEVAKKAHSVTGIDIRPQNISLAKKRYHQNNLEFVIGDATQYEFDNTFDAIVLSNVLEHIEDRIPFLQKLSEIAPTILIRVPMLTRDWITVFKKNSGLEYRLDDTHFIEYTVETFQKEIEQAKLHLDKQLINFGELYAVVTSQR